MCQGNRENWCNEVNHIGSWALLNLHVEDQCKRNDLHIHTYIHTIVHIFIHLFILVLSFIHKKILCGNIDRCRWDQHALPKRHVREERRLEGSCFDICKYFLWQTGGNCEEIADIATLNIIMTRKRNSGVSLHKLCATIWLHYRGSIN